MEHLNNTDLLIRQLLQQLPNPEAPAGFTNKIMNKLEQGPAPVYPAALIPTSAMIGVIITILALMSGYLWQHRGELQWQENHFLNKIMESISASGFSVSLSVNANWLYLATACCLLFTLQLFYIQKISEKDQVFR